MKSSAEYMHYNNIIIDTVTKIHCPKCSVGWKYVSRTLEAIAMIIGLVRNSLSIILPLEVESF